MARSAAAAGRTSGQAEVAAKPLWQRGRVSVVKAFDETVEVRSGGTPHPCIHLQPRQLAGAGCNVEMSAAIGQAPPTC